MEFVRLLLLLGTLLYGSYYDWKSREVADIVWIPSSIAGISLQVYEIVFLGHIVELYLTASSVSLTTAAVASAILRQLQSGKGGFVKQRLKPKAFITFKAFEGEEHPNYEFLSFLY